MDSVIEVFYILGGLCTLLIFFVELRWRGHPLHVASRQIPGEYIWPFIGNMVEVIGINSQGNCC